MLKRITMLLTTALMSSGLAPAGPVTLSAEQAERSGGVRLSTSRPAFSGEGYLTGFERTGDRADWTFTPTDPSDGGHHRIRIRYAAPEGGKQFVLEVNGRRFSGTFAPTQGQFVLHEVGRVFLRPGENRLGVFGGWHHYEIDRVELLPEPVPPRPIPPPAVPADPSADTGARGLLARLISTYGKATLSGTIAGEDRYVREVTGVSPAVIAGDLMQYSRTAIENNADTKRETERMIEAHRAGHIVTLLWHWYAPADNYNGFRTNSRGQQVDARWDRSFYSNATQFDVEKAVNDPNSREHELFIADIDLIAAQLRILADAGVPVLWRPLHEAEGRWFWWGAKGPEPFRKAWRMMFDRLTRHHGLHNLLWVYTGDESPEWYPGDDVVDIIGVDAYPGDAADPLTQTWDALQKAYGGRKLVALTEIGGVPDVELAAKYGVYWSYFVSWSGDLGPKKLPPDELRRIYAQPQVRNLPERLK